MHLVKSNDSEQTDRVTRILTKTEILIPDVFPFESLGGLISDGFKLVIKIEDCPTN